ncbi:hypothetical protein AaE_007228 [Aphanomyces astaci]|uniref:Uncharacterized protein n=1 Tax=Aphanomyces astaci TaxID=112090 RepID=A0A6A5AIP3_APHAT|nr:hypothetical protein AaE_007228 [Aphanomyces astaci]
MAAEGTDDDASIDLLKDLHFLIATDQQVQDDFSYLCDLLDETASEQTGGECASAAGFAKLDLQHTSPTSEATSSIEPSSTTAKTSSTKRKNVEKDNIPPTGARNRFQYRQRQELKALKAQVEELKAQLAAECSKSSSRLAALSEASPWEQAARDELVERNRAHAENKQLKDALGDQSTFVDQMQKLFKKKPRLMAEDPSSLEEWQAYKLAAQHSLRVAAIHAIADRQYFYTKYKVPKHRNASIETLDRHTVYQKLAETVGGVTLHSNSIRRYYSSTKRDVIVWRTVLEDALVPHMSRGSVNNEWGWMEVAPTKDGNLNQCRMTFLIQSAVDAVTDGLVGDALDDFKAGIERFGLNEGAFTENPNISVRNEIMHAHMARGKRFQDTLQAAVVSAISDYYGTRQP